MNHQFHDPPYARLENSKDEEMESEEGYETIPASERQNHNGNLVLPCTSFGGTASKLFSSGLRPAEA